MKDNRIDVVIGPIETYEDQRYGYKAAHEGYVLLKDMAWSDRLQRFAALLPGLQEGLPVAAEYKAETPGRDSDLNAYDVVYYAGDANAGSKTIAINLPNDEEVQLARGTRRLQLKNAMRAKFDQIMVPIAGELIDAEQRRVAPRFGQEGRRIPVGLVPEDPIHGGHGGQEVANDLDLGLGQVRDIGFEADHGVLVDQGLEIGHVGGGIGGCARRGRDDDGGGEGECVAHGGRGSSGPGGGTGAPRQP